MNDDVLSQAEAWDLNELGTTIVDACYHVHKEMGPGLTEIIYKDCLEDEFNQRGIKVEREVQIDVAYKGRALKHKYFADFIVGDSIVLEIKAVTELIPVHEAQLLNYLKLTKLKLGYLVNFNVKIIGPGIKRRKNGYW